jgi:hypothetical protein
MTYHLDSLSTTRRPLISPASEPAARQTAGTRRISAAYTNSVCVLRAAVRGNWEAGRGRIKDERADDTSLEIIDTVVALDPAARRTLRLVAGQLKRACAGPRPRVGPLATVHRRMVHLLTLPDTATGRNGE